MNYLERKTIERVSERRDNKCSSCAAKYVEGGRSIAGGGGDAAAAEEEAEEGPSHQPVRPYKNIMGMGYFQRCAKVVGTEAQKKSPLTNECVSP